MATGLMIVLSLFAEYSSMAVLTFVFAGAAGEIFARNAQVSAAAFGTPGNGMAGDSVRYTGVKSLVASTILTIIISISYWAVASYALLDGFTYSHLAVLFTGIAISIVWGFIISRIAERNFGMVNGDVLGATNETSRVVIIFAMLSMIRFMEL